MSARWWGAIACGIVMVLGAGPARGQDAAPAAAAKERTTLTLMVSEVDATTVNVLARLTGANGRIVGNRPIAFALIEPFFGDRPVRLGAATTISTGVATYMYRPSYEGEHRIRATFAGDVVHSPSAADIRYVVAPGAFVPVSIGTHPIATVWRITGMVAAAVTATVWLGLLGIVVWIWIGFRRTAGRGEG